ncbi:helix-turn-helix domain-containing protein [Paenibacillus mesophilus]|uniref:helix-turn-helix transcriptional regulator n=1 Tax=Paenibacillus mesophilus TaxID=2582849 RepID=UPI00110DE24F|nr:helix-turn-helix transcriptional regulator [Paenibacillus mesophilus]TMV50061.1 helix-turn-helix domain-containing protein [Paenibacillus mesophilus]
MTSDISYTTEEIAKLLKISKLTVYDLIKKGILPAYRVGKQMRIDAVDLETYKAQAKGGRPAVFNSGPIERSAMIGNPVSGTVNRSLVITGQDVCLDLLARYIESNIPGFRALRSYVGSMDSLISMYRGEADIVSTHLLDGDTGEYNLPFIRKLLVGLSYMVVNLVSRTAGLYVRQGNPKRITGWTDLNRPELRIVNRERGSGARVLLDEQMRMHGIPRQRINGYEHEETNHLSVAGKVASGEADIGIGVEKTAQLVGGVDFIPLINERYDLVMLKTPDNLQWIEQVRQIIRSERFRNDLYHMQGYDTSLTGQVLLET